MVVMSVDLDVEVVGVERRVAANEPRRHAGGAVVVEHFRADVERVVVVENSHFGALRGGLPFVRVDLRELGDGCRRAPRRLVELAHRARSDSLAAPPRRSAPARDGRSWPQSPSRPACAGCCAESEAAANITTNAKDRMEDVWADTSDTNGRLPVPVSTQSLCGRAWRGGFSPCTDRTRSRPP